MESLIVKVQDALSAGGVSAAVKAAGLGAQAALSVADNVLQLAKDTGAKKAEATVAKGLASTQDAFGLSKTLADPAASNDPLASIFGVRLGWEKPDEAAGAAGQAAQAFEGRGEKGGLSVALQLLALAQLQLGNMGQASEHARSALDLAKGLGDRDAVLAAVTTLMSLHASSWPADPALMLAAAEEAVAHFKGLGDKRGAAGALHLAAAVQYASFARKGEPKEARKAAEAAVAFYRGLEDAEGQAAVLRTVIHASLGKGLLDEALRAAKDLLGLQEERGDRRAEARALDAVASLHMAKDNARKALKVAQEALAAAQEAGDAELEQEVLRTLASVYFLRRDGDGALRAAQDLLASYQAAGNRPGEATAMALLFRVYQLSSMDDEALKSAYEGLAILREQDDKQGMLKIMEPVAAALLDKKAYAEAAEVAQDALTITRELRLYYSEGCTMFLIAKTNISSQEGIACAYEAARIFREADYKKEAADAYHAAANGILLMRGPARDAIGAAAEGLNLFKELGNKQGEAVMMHTVANCQLSLRETENAVNTAYEAMAMFEKCGDRYGTTLAKKLLLGVGQSDEEIKERREQQMAQFDGVETRVGGETNEEKRRMEDEAQDLQNNQVLWELAWIPWETQDPKNFGEKFAGGSRRVFVAGEMQDKGVLSKLMKARPNKSGTGAAYFSNLLNGRQLNKDTLQFGMTACQCLSVIFDVSKLNHHGPLEVIDLTLKLVQALVPIEDRKVALDFVTTSCQNLAWTAGVQEPFHATLWGFCRAARMENPTHEFRLLDVDPARRTESMAFICRYLTGAQATRPAEAICRNRGVMVSRLVGARSKLNLPVRIELESRY